MKLEQPSRLYQGAEAKVHQVDVYPVVDTGGFLMCVLKDVLVGAIFFAVDQVWSLTQIYSVDFSQSWIGVKKCIQQNQGLLQGFLTVSGKSHLTVS